MLNRRLLLTVIIKLLSFSALLLLLYVFINSLFTNTGNEQSASTEEFPLVIMDIAEMQAGQVKKVRWNGKEVAVLLRQFSKELQKSEVSSSEKNIHASINPQTRSINDEYFVYYNIGDSSNCPLYYAGGEFKDVCSLNKFDEAGRDLKANTQSFKLQIPPHYFDKNTVIFGKWQS